MDLILPSLKRANLFQESLRHVSQINLMISDGAGLQVTSSHERKKFCTIFAKYVIGMFEYISPPKQVAATKTIRDVHIRNKRDETLKVTFWSAL